MANKELSEQKHLINSDKVLISTLKSCLGFTSKNRSFRNQIIEKHAALLPNRSALSILHQLLTRMGTFDFNQENHLWRDIDNQQSKVTLVRATKIPVWPMGTNIFLRDNILIADRLLKYDSFNRERYNKLGSALLRSCITIISSKSQLNRFLSIIKSSSKKFRNDPLNWPQVFLNIQENLNGSKSDPWSQKQDSWQMIGYHIASRLVQGSLKASFLNQKYRYYLAMIIPFLIKVDHVRQENSGSWEEVTACRSSVLAWEVSLIYQLSLLAKDRNFEFLSSIYNSLKKHLPSPFNRLSYHESCNHLVEISLKTLLKRIPHEAPEYSKNNPRYRGSDAALIYLLQLDIPSFIVNFLGLGSSVRDKIERSILANILSLYDHEVGGLRRYHGDSYQRQGFFRFQTTYNLKKRFGALSGDVSNQMKIRDKIVPKGKEALWTHPTWQLSAWAGRRYIESCDLSFLSLQRQLFYDGLRMITGDNEATIREDGSGKIGITKINSFRIPECYLTEVDQKRSILIYPSTHTPLYWSIAESLDAFNMYEKTVKH